MRHFQNLQNILEMDFTQMRGLPCAGGMRATDEAIRFFVRNLMEFHSQFTELPTQEELRIYKEMMEQITNVINISECAYHLKKYINEYPEEDAQLMASMSALKTFKDIPKRMQYWAASEKFGDTIRNAHDHIITVKNLDKWAALVTQYARDLFFQPKVEKKAGLPAEKYDETRSGLS